MDLCVSIKSKAELIESELLRYHVKQLALGGLERGEADLSAVRSWS